MASEFGDFAIEGSATTLDDFNGVPIYEFTPVEDGAYTIACTLVAWQPGGATVQYYVQAVWRSVGGGLAADGAPLVSAVGTLTPTGISTDAIGGKARLLVSGVAGTPVLWRLKGHRFDVTSSSRGAVSGDGPGELGDTTISGSAATNDDNTPVPLYTFKPEKDGVYTVQAIVAVWLPGGRCAQYYVENNWSKIAGTLALDGALYADSAGTLAPTGLTADVSAGSGRLLAQGVEGPLLWRLKGVRLDVTA